MASLTLAAAVQAAGELSDLDWLGPAVTALGGVIVAIVGGISLIWRRRQDRKDELADKTLEKLPSEKDGWEEIREARRESTRYYRLYRLFEEMFYSVQAALRNLAREFHERHPDVELDQAVLDALALKPPEDLDRV